jgi:hypothetical protein
MRFSWVPIGAIVASAGSAYAFQPNEAGHLGITSEGLSPIERTLNGRTYRFTDAAIYEVRDQNRNQDFFAFYVEEAHFDNESLDSGSARLMALKEEAIQHLLEKPPNGEDARDALGAALHTVQDFYSHSNWVEMGQTTIETQLGRGLLTPLSISVATCPVRPDTLDGDGLTQETTGYYELPNPCTPPPDGKCLHGVEGICSGINKDFAGRFGYEAARDLAVLATNDFASQILDDPRIASDEAAIAALMGVDEQLPTVLISAIDSGLDSSDLRRFTFPVDPSIDRLIVSFEVLGAEGKLVRPSGEEVQPGDLGVTIVTGVATYSAAIEAPASGTWTVKIGGAGPFSLRVRGRAGIAIHRMELVGVSGTPGHEGLFGLPVTPPKHGSAGVLARIVGVAETASFATIDLKGKVIDRLRMSLGDPRAGSGEWVGLVRIPNKPFRTMVTGRDAAGNLYQRVSETLFIAGT